MYQEYVTRCRHLNAMGRVKRKFVGGDQAVCVWHNRYGVPTRIEIGPATGYTESRYEQRFEVTDEPVEVAWLPTFQQLLDMHMAYRVLIDVDVLRELADLLWETRRNGKQHCLEQVALDQLLRHVSLSNPPQLPEREFSLPDELRSNVL